MKLNLLKDMEAIAFKIGLRTTKTVISVFLCFLLDSMRTGGIPFYATIAAILCVQQDLKNSWTIAKNREVATIIGGLWGMLFLFLESRIIAFEPEILRQLVLSLMLIPIIHFSVMIHQPKATFLMCVVFLSVTVTHGGDNNPFLFAVNRILDTSMGIAVALVVNAIPFEKLKKGKKITEKEKL